MLGILSSCKFFSLVFLSLLLASSSIIVMTVALTLDTGNTIKVIGCYIRNYRAVNGTFVFSFLIQSEVAISSCVVSYVDQYEQWVNATTSLIEGDANYGWWEATTSPKVVEEKTDGETRYCIYAMKLYALLPHEVIELSIQSLLPSWSIREEKVTFPLFEEIESFFMVGGVFSAIGLAIALKLNHRKRSFRGEM